MVAVDMEEGAAEDTAVEGTAEEGTAEVMGGDRLYPPDPTQCDPNPFVNNIKRCSHFDATKLCIIVVISPMYNKTALVKRLGVHTLYAWLKLTIRFDN